jgi:hypothetical protein
MDRIVCEWCKEQNPPDRIDCVKCGAPLDVRDRIRDPGASVAQPSWLWQQIPGGPPRLFQRLPDGGLVASQAALLASGQPVSAVLKSFTPAGTTPRGRGSPAGTYNPPELYDSPDYWLEVEFQDPNRRRFLNKARIGRWLQPVPATQVPNLAPGLELPCMVDRDSLGMPGRFFVDWRDTAAPPRSNR